MKRSTTIYIIAQISLLFAGTVTAHWLGQLVGALSPNYGWSLPILRHYAIPSWITLAAIIISALCMVICGAEKRRARAQQSKDNASDLNQ